MALTQRKVIERKRVEPMSTKSPDARIEELAGIVAPHGSALVAFSGGVDSSLALAVAATRSAWNTSS
jgi:tRNA(Ile)-lysidine synthase TilS/MesJ